eukprot:m.228540 g.228540  ORF g.228540 m.228540 type:complete len:237 (+) comp15981_c0_seq4:54-764(+)
METTAEETLKRLLKTFDLASNAVVDLAGKQLSPKDTAPLARCTSARWVDLSSNKLVGDLHFLSPLVNITDLNLSHNHIKSLEGADKLVNLQVLDVVGNNIEHFESFLPPLCKLQNLRQLSLQTLDGEFSNPVCSLEAYDTKVIQQLPFLNALDGKRLQGEAKLFYQDCKDVQKLITQQHHDLVGADNENNGLLEIKEAGFKEQFKEEDQRLQDELLECKILLKEDVNSSGTAFMTT